MSDKVVWKVRVTPDVVQTMAAIERLWRRLNGPRMLYGGLLARLIELELRRLRERAERQGVDWRKVEEDYRDGLDLDLGESDAPFLGVPDESSAPMVDE